MIFINNIFFPIKTIAVPNYHQLYEALNVGEHQVKKERELFTKLEELNDQLSPLEEVR